MKTRSSDYWGVIGLVALALGVVTIAGARLSGWDPLRDIRGAPPTSEPDPPSPSPGEDDSFAQRLAEINRRMANLQPGEGFVVGSDAEGEALMKAQLELMQEAGIETWVPDENGKLVPARTPEEE